MKKAWSVLLMLVGIALIGGGIHLITKSYSLIALTLEGYDVGDPQTNLILGDLANMRWFGIAHGAIGLILIHQALKFHLDMKK